MSGMIRILYCLLVLAVVVSCKNKPKKTIEELPVKVAKFDKVLYQKASIDSIHLASMKRFGSVYDSSAFQRDIDSIARFFADQELEEVFYTKSGVVYAVKKYGRGEYPVPGDRLQVQCVTKRWDGKVFFSTEAIKEPLEFVLGVGQVVPAWDEVLQNVPTGSELLIVAPSAMSYGKKSIPRALPGNTILTYDVTVEKHIPAENIKGEGLKPSFNLEEDNNIPVSLRKPIKKPGS